MVWRQRSPHAPLGPISEEGIVRHGLARGQCIGGSLIFELDVPGLLDEFADKDLYETADGRDDGFGNGLAEGVVDELGEREDGLV
jgi:hypothetical protein